MTHRAAGVFEELFATSDGGDFLGIGPLQSSRRRQSGNERTHFVALPVGQIESGGVRRRRGCRAWVNRLGLGTHLQAEFGRTRSSDEFIQCLQLSSPTKTADKATVHLGVLLHLDRGDCFDLSLRYRVDQAQAEERCGVSFSQQ